MQQLPETENPLVLRTDFSSDAAWDQICVDIQRPVGDFLANVEFLSDPQYEGLTPEQIPSLLPSESDQACIFIVDKFCLEHSEKPILVVDLLSEQQQSFRVIPSSMWNVENNLSLGNLDFEDFSSTVDAENIFRGL